MNKTFKLFCLFVLVTFSGALLTACGGDDEEITIKGRLIQVRGNLTMTVVMGGQAVDCGTVQDNFTFHSNDDSSIAAVTLSEFTTPPIPEYRNAVISMSEIKIQAVKLTTKSDGTLSFDQDFQDVAVESCDLGNGQPLKNFTISGHLYGVVSADGKITTNIQITKMGSMPYTLVLDFES